MNRLITALPYAAVGLMAWGSWNAYQIAQAFPWGHAVVIMGFHYPLALWGGGFAIVPFNWPVRMFALAFAGLNILLMGGVTHG